MDRVGIGIIGCGAISERYFESAARWPDVEVVSCADLDPAKARARGEQFSVACAATPEELLHTPGLDLVVNLTVPLAHAAVQEMAFHAGKSVYSEKPLAVSVEEASRVLDAAADAGSRVGCAPDTFLGAAQQTARALIDGGEIGQPVAATAFFTCRGHESWHPNPEFYYQAGGGPLFDMGPYYLTALVNLLGPVRRVTGSARVTFPERTITSAPKSGTRIAVEVPTHVSAVLDFECGAVATLLTSFDVWAANLPRIEVYGTEGTLGVPDPNGFGGEVRIARAGEEHWAAAPHTHAHAGESRGIGVADMARALRTGRPHRANGELAFHVVEVMEAIHRASEEGRHVVVSSTCSRPAALPAGLKDFELDD